MFVIKLSSFSSLAFVCQSFCCVDSFSNLHVGEEVGRPWIAVCGCSRGGWRYRTGLSSIRHCHGGNQPRLCHSWSYHECEQCKTWTWFSKDSWNGLIYLTHVFPLYLLQITCSSAVKTMLYWLLRPICCLDHVQFFRSKTAICNVIGSCYSD